MVTVEQLKKRVDELAPAREDGLTEDELAVHQMSDEEIEQRAVEILRGNTDHLDPDIVRQARDISEKRRAARGP